MSNATTIAAIATALGEAAVGIIKLSGPDSFSIAHKLTNIDIASLNQPKDMKLAWVHDSKQVVLDQALILFFRAPYSYTGEDVVEFQIHGGLWLMERVLAAVLELGARIAKAGEFTERAVLNGKLDLSQAESIMDLVQARTGASGNSAIKLYRGELGQKIRELRNDLLAVMGEITASIDFPDEVGAYPREKFSEFLNQKIEIIEGLLAGEKYGQILRQGYRITIVGNANAGKSTLLNRLLKRDRAIVTSIAGTTRDLLEESYSLRGIPVVLTDTAGIRNTEDLVEQIGIRKSKEAMQNSDLILLLEDVNTCPDEALRGMLRDFKHIKIANKIDLKPDYPAEDYDIGIASLYGDNIEKLEELIYQLIIGDVNVENSLSINARQAELLRRSLESLRLAWQSVNASQAEDFWTIDLRAAIIALGEITGEALSEELLDNIFSRFCIGK